MIFGLGVTGFSRISPFYMLEGYRLFCGRNTPDLEILRHLGPIRSMEEETGIVEENITSIELTSYGPFREELEGRRPDYLYVYQSHRGLESTLQNTGIQIIANRAELRERLSPKPAFMEILRELGLPTLDWELISLRSFLDLKPKEAFGRFKGPFALQVKEITRGGGRGVFFIKDEEGLLRAKKALADGILHKVKVEKLLMRPLIEGISLSALGCTTKSGVIVGPLQVQLIDLYGESPIGERGIFCGHSWGGPQKGETEAQVRHTVEEVGKFLWNIGYRGIFGIDFVADRKRVYPIELNPRITGALPVLSLLQLREGYLPIEFLHVLSFFDGAEFDIHVINTEYAKGLEGGQVLVFADENESTFYPTQLKPGLYRWESNEITYLGGSGFLPLRDYEFALVEGPYAGIGPGKKGWNNFWRLLRLVFKNSITNDNGTLLDWVEKVIYWVREVIFGGRTQKVSCACDHPSFLKRGP